MPEVFADTFYGIALLNPADKWHQQARTFSQSNPEFSLVTTDAVWTEVLNYFSEAGERMRQAAVALCEQAMAHGNTVVLTATTDDNGFYQFSHLRAGTYSIFRTSDPAGLTPDGLPYADGANTVGSLGGTNQESGYSTSDGILNIVVGRGQAGVNYNFGFWDADQPH